MEKDYIYEITNELSDLNQNNILKPYSYQKLFDQVVDRHLNNINLNMDQIMRNNLAWVLISLSIEIVKPVEGITKMFAQTWCSQHKRPFFRREFIFKNEKGEILFHGTSFSILFDMNKRTLYRKKELPFDIDISNDDFTIEATPTIHIDSKFEKVDERKVYNSYIDCLGHVNNIRYSEFAYDTFSEEECMNICNFKRMDLYFRSELRNNDNFSVLKAYENNKIIVRGYNNTKSDNSFDIIFEF